jgi:hypothetical protein
MATGGPLESITLNNRRFSVDGEVNAMISLSGFTNEVKPNGDLVTFRIIKTAKSGKAKSIPIIIDNARGDTEFIQKIMDSLEPVPFFATETDGTVWEGSVMIVGDPEKSTKEATMEIEIHGTVKRQGV